MGSHEQSPVHQLISYDSDESMLATARAAPGGRGGGVAGMIMGQDGIQGGSDFLKNGLSISQLEVLVYDRGWQHQ